MSLTSGFFNSQNGDRIYSTYQISEFLDGLVEDGIYKNINDGNHLGFQVYELSTPGMGVNVGMGRAWFNQTWTYNSSSYEVLLSPSSAILSRIDAICLRIDKTREGRNNSIVVVEGDAASEPEKPEVVNSSGIYNYILAWVSVPAGTSSISNANIENNIGIGIPFIKGVVEEGITTEELLTQWKGEFDEWFDYMKDQLSEDAAGHLQQEVDNLQDEIDTINDSDSTPGGIEDSEKLYTSGGVYATVSDLQASFQAGVDAVYNAVRAEGGNPSASTPTAIAQAIGRIRDGGDATAAQILKPKTAYSGKTLTIGTMENRGAWTGTGTPTGNNSVNVTIPAGYHNGNGYVTAKGTSSYSAGYSAAKTKAYSYATGSYTQDARAHMVHVSSYCRSALGSVWTGEMTNTVDNALAAAYSDISSLVEQIENM